MCNNQTGVSSVNTDSLPVGVGASLHRKQQPEGVERRLSNIYFANAGFTEEEIRE